MRREREQEPKTKLAAGLTLALLIAGCSGAGDGANNSSDEYGFKVVAENLVKEQLRDPASAEFSGLSVYPGSADKPTIICGYVNSANAFGGKTGPQRFVVGGTVAIEENFSTSDMDQIWNRFCH